MKVAIVLCAIAATAVAAPPRHARTTRLDPKLSDHVRAAEQAWTAAERGPASAALWEQAAEAFTEVDTDPLDVKVKRDAAYAAVLAWDNALGSDTPPASPKDDVAKPRPFTAREDKLVAAADRYVKYATDPGGPEMPAVLLIKARTYSRFDQLETAIPIYRSIVDRFPEAAVAGYAAQLLLDSYNRLKQYDALVAVADELAKNKRLLAGRDDLITTVKQIQRQAQRRHAEQLERAARDANDFDTYSATGRAYLDIYNADPEAGGGDELLYNAAVSFESGRALGSAISTFTLLIKEYAHSKLALKALRRLGSLYADLAMYDKAADKLEEYATKYAGEKDAYEALSDAIYYRKATGNRERVIFDTKYFIKTFGLKRPSEAADASWSLIGLEPDPDTAIKRLQDYLRTYGAKGGSDRIVIAHAKMGQLLWKQSCPVPGVDGLCVRETEEKKTCGQGAVRVFATAARDPRKTKDAMIAMSAAIHAYDSNPSDDAAVRASYAQAKLVLADAELEPYFALAFPRDLSFDPHDSTKRAASMKKFQQWLEQRQTTGEKATRRYEAILAIKDIATSITAAERMAIIARDFASAMVTAEVPREIRSGPHAAQELEAYCKALSAAAEPLEAHATAGFGVCLAKSSELGWFNESSKRCELELSGLAPADFPRLTEVRSQPGDFAPVIAIEPPMR